MRDSTEATPRPGVANWLSGGGEMGERIRAFDWANSPLGPVETWPQSLKTAVRIMLTSRQPIWLGWGEQLIKLYNDSYITIVGGKHPTALGQPASVVWREIWPQIGPMLETAMGGVEGTYVEEQRLIMERNGYPEETFYTFSYSPIPNDEGGAGGIICVNTDDTQRVVSARQVGLLRELASRTADARTVEQACALSTDCLSTDPYDLPFAMIYLTDPGSRGVVLAGNPWGIERGHTAAAPFVALDEPSVWPFKTVLRTNRACLVSDLSALEKTLPRDAANRAPHQAVALPIAAQGREGEVGILIVGLNPYRLFDANYQGFLDLVSSQIASAIANARAYEEARQRAEALAELDRAKTTFFSNISHEFRTPLTLMLAPLEETLELHGDLPPTVREQIALARGNGVRLLKLVNTLLDFSRIEAGRTDVSYEPVDLARFTADLASVFRSAIERAGLKYIVNCDDPGEPIYVDRDMYEKVVLNLISNAFKFTFEGEIEVRLRAGESSVQLSVRDTGTGIPETELRHVFERFHRVKGAKGRSIEGSGIGLSLVQELVRLHHGDVTVESVFHEGSTFTVTLPRGSAHLPSDRLIRGETVVAKAHEVNSYVEEALRWLPSEMEPAGIETRDSFTPSLKPPHGRLPNGARVLLADDNVDMREYLRRLLLEAGYTVVVVADGEVALTAAQTEPFDLVLSDVMMPRLDGFGLLKALRDDPHTATIPVILLSARAGEESRVEGLEAGADDYLVKPFSARELTTRVESHIKLAGVRREQEARTAADLKAMEHLNEVGNRCSRMGHDFEGCLDAIMDAAITITGAQKGNLQLYEAKTGELRIATHRGFDEPFLKFFGVITDKEAAACSAALRSSERVIVEDVEQSEIFAGQASLTELLEANVRAVQSTPLISSSGKIFGTISTHFRLRHRPSERDLRLLDLLARQTADYLERRQAEEELRVREDQLKTLVEATPLGVYVVDADFSLRQVNVTALPVFGDIPDLIGRDFSEVIHILWPAQYADEIVRLFRHTLETGESYIMPERIEKRLDRGVTEYYEWRIDRIPLPDGRFGVVCYFRDISMQVLARQQIAESEERHRRLALENQKLYQQEQRMREAAEAATRAKDEFLAVVSHELRSPLNAILGHAHLLRASRRDDTEVRKVMDVIERNGRSQIQLIEDLLDTARIISGKLKLDVRRFDLRSVVNAAIDSMLPAAASKNIRVDFVCPGEASAYEISGDADRLQQVVWNLLSNAVKFTNQGGRVQVALSRESSSVRIVVSDTGKGISADFLPFVFDRFSQGDSSASRRFGGLGLGLSLVKQLTELHGGDVHVESLGEGEGATFTVNLPIRPEPRNNASQNDTQHVRTLHSRPAGYRLDGLNILVVDDDETARDLLSLTLQEHGAITASAASTSGALETLQDSLHTVYGGKPFDVLISDIGMPGEDGYDLMRRVRTHIDPRVNSIRAVALTAYARFEDRLRALEAGYQTHLAKPVEESELNTVIAALTGRISK